MSTIAPASRYQYLRRVTIRIAIACSALLAIALLTEYALEARDTARYMRGQTFATVGDSHIRYRLMGIGRPGATAVLLSGMNASIEQADKFQTAISARVPALAYDRAGYGFSRGSTAHSAEAQAIELAGLLSALHIDKPVVLVAYSSSADVARVFAGRFPEKTAGLYMIAPLMPNLEKLVPAAHSQRRRYARLVIFSLIKSAIGFSRLHLRLHDWHGPASLVDQRAEAVLVRRPHYLALAREWYAFPESSAEATAAPVPAHLPIEVVYVPEDGTSVFLRSLYAQFVARSTRGRIVEFGHVDHSQLMKPGAAFDQMVERVEQLSLGNLPQP